MRSPTRTLAGHLRWTRSGTVWADFVLSPLAYGFRPDKDKHVVRDLHQALLRSLPGESLLQSVCSGLDAGSVVERMIDGVDLAACPEWAAECEATLDSLDEISPGQRTYWLSVPLGATSRLDRLRTPWQSATAGLRDSLALPRAGVGQAELHRRLEQARRVEQSIPHLFRPRPATPAQILWLHLHAQQRGALVDLDVPVGADGGLSGELMAPRSGVCLGEPMLDEGGQSDLTRTQLRGWNPADRRYLKVDQPGRPGLPPSYQALMVLSDVPAAGMLYPGCEFLGRIDEAGLEVDWAVRLHVRGSHEATMKNKRALVHLNEQYQQREGEQSHGLGTLDRAATELAEYAEVLRSDEFEVEVQPTTIFTVAGPDPQTCTDQARALTAYFARFGFKVSQPLGYQEELWWATQPGVPSGRAVREFAQITTSKALASAVPLASTQLGDGKGSLLALNISSGRPGVVLHDIAGASARDISGSMAIAGEKGAGKSLLMKKMAGDVVDRRGRIIAVDRSKSGEWASWARSVTVATIVDCAEPTVSLDPLRLFGAEEGGRVTQSFLTPLLNIDPTSKPGILLSKVLDPQYLAEHAIGGLGSLLVHLRDGCALPGAGDLGDLMNVYASKSIGRIVFDESLPALSPTAPATIIRTNKLELPRREELENEHLFKTLKLEKRFGRAMYALIAALARQICFSDLRVLGVFFLDEAHHVTASPEGEYELVEFVRDDRKHTAAIVMGSHDALADFGSATLRGLIPTKILMRLRDKTLAQRGLAWLDLDPEDTELVQMLTEDTSPVTARGVAEHRRGEGFLRDSSGNIGRIKVLPPALPERNEAVRTSPPENALFGAVGDGA